MNALASILYTYIAHCINLKSNARRVRLAWPSTDLRCRNSKTSAVFFCRYCCIGRCASSSWFWNCFVCGEIFFFQFRRGERLKKMLFEERELLREKGLPFVNEERWRSRSIFFGIFIQNWVRKCLLQSDISIFIRSKSSVFQTREKPKLFTKKSSTQQGKEIEPLSFHD